MAQYVCYQLYIPIDKADIIVRQEIYSKPLIVEYINKLNRTFGFDLPVKHSLRIDFYDLSSKSFLRGHWLDLSIDGILRSSSFEHTQYGQYTIIKLYASNKSSMSYALPEPKKQDEEKHIVNEEKQNNEDDPLTCGICMANKKEIMFNCGHALCNKCSALEKCPFCSAQPTSRIKMFLNC